MENYEDQMALKSFPSSIDSGGTQGPIFTVQMTKQIRKAEHPDKLFQSL